MSKLIIWNFEQILIYPRENHFIKVVFFFFSLLIELLLYMFLGLKYLRRSD